eukprot:scaffold2271_cov130-Cylindrotheca_fusiformis.AAC.10
MSQVLRESSHVLMSSPLSPRRCLCEFSANDTSASCADLKCPACVKQALKPHLDRNAQAKLAHQKAKEDCARELSMMQNHHRLAELQSESRRLREKLQQLKASCGTMAVRVASQAVENDSKQESSSFSQNIEQHHLSLTRLEDGLVQTSMQNAIHTATFQVRVLRFQWARKALAMHRLDIDPEDVIHKQPVKLPSQQQSQQSQLRRARGIGKIGGLPLPHAGPELYGVLPPRELQSALRLVASVTWTVARALGIVLPHPIMLTPNATAGDITNIGKQPITIKPKKKHLPPSQPQHLASSATSLLSSVSSSATWYLKRGAKKAYAKATGQSFSSRSTSSTGETRPTPYGNTFTTSTTPSSTYHEQLKFSSPSTDSRTVAQRIHHATAAVLRDDTSTTASEFALSPLLQGKEDEFAIALQLLQNNVICLCIRAGVPVGQLWPAEAVLLNLYALDRYCEQQTAVEY